MVWIIGLAVPVTASYIICAVIAAPALTKLGVPDFAAHMFIFYYSVLSEVSPPTALSPFAAAAITGGDPYVTTMQAWKYTLPAFLVPFVFVLDPQGVGLLMKIPRTARSGSTSSWVTLKSADRPGRARRRGAELGNATQHPIEAGLWLLAGLLLVFPSLLEAGPKRSPASTCRHPAPFGLALGAAILLKQKYVPLKPAAETNRH